MERKYKIGDRVTFREGSAFYDPLAPADGGLFGGAVNKVSETGGAKRQKLAQIHNIPTDALLALSEHYGLGEKRYPTGEDGVPNFLLGYPMSLSYDALMRHALAWWGGEDLDPDPDFGDSHLLAVAWHALNLWTNQHLYGDRFDDRPAVALRKLLDPEPRSEN